MPTIIDLPEDDRERAPRADTAPPRDEPKPKPKGRTTKADRVREQISDTYAMLGGMATTFDPVWGNYVADMSDDIADAWMQAAENNPRIMAGLQKFTEGGSVAGLVMAHGMLLAPFLARRNLIPKPIGLMALGRNDWVQENMQPVQTFAYIQGQPFAAPEQPADVA